MVMPIVAGAFLLYLLQPFITAVVCWQGYKLMVGRAFPLKTIEDVFTMIQWAVYFEIAVVLLLFSWSQWNKYCADQLRER